MATAVNVHVTVTTTASKLGSAPDAVVWVSVRVQVPMWVPSVGVTVRTGEAPAETLMKLGRLA